MLCYSLEIEPLHSQNHQICGPYFSTVVQLQSIIMTPSCCSHRLFRFCSCCLNALWTLCDRFVKGCERSMGGLLLASGFMFSWGKRTQRIEALRDAMGVGAFSEMVSRQLWTRRTRGSSPSGGQDWAQTLQWWHSDEGMMYWNPPPQPHPQHVSDVLRRGLGRGLPGCFPVPVEKTLEVPKSVVPYLALRITDWLQERQEERFPGLKSRCFMSGRVNFNREDGERVPSVHISCKQHMGDNLVLLLGWVS